MVREHEEITSEARDLSPGKGTRNTGFLILPA
jgi:hypothetical protein